MSESIEIELRVRYAECDPMNVAHHSAYPAWLEIARTEQLRRDGVAYRDLEAQGVLFVVAKMSLTYHKPAYYDDVLRVTAQTTHVGRVKVEHTYEIWRDDAKLATAATTLACVDRDGKVRPIPEGVMR